MSIKHIIQALLLIFILHSCSVSKNKVAAIRESNISGFSLVEFNGDYRSNPDFCYEKNNKNCIYTPSLWKALYSCKKIQGDSVKVSPNSFVNLNFDGKSRLMVSLFDSGKMIKQIELKAKVYKNNVAVKRKLFLIPFVPIFYIRQERRVLLGNNSDRSLNAGFSEITEAQIFFGGGSRYLYTLHYPKIVK